MILTCTTSILGVPEVERRTSTEEELAPYFFWLECWWQGELQLLNDIKCTQILCMCIEVVIIEFCWIFSRFRRHKRLCSAGVYIYTFIRYPICLFQGGALDGGLVLIGPAPAPPRTCSR
jgi:hypothetical protein